MKTTTPLAVFAYNRPNHLQKTLEALGRCRRLDECQVYIYCDGPKRPEQTASVEETCAVASFWSEGHKAEVVVSDKNLGLSRSITTRVSQLCTKFGCVIVLEDDLIVSPAFVDFMLQALDRYENDETVFQVAGFVFGKKPYTNQDAFLMPISTTWGWATWARAWKHYRRDPQAALSDLENPDFKSRFNIGGKYPYSKMLEDNIEGKNDSWGIWWWWTVCANEGLVVFPKKSLVYNNGFDRTGTHCDEAVINQPEIKDLETFQDGAKLNFPPR